MMSTFRVSLALLLAFISTTTGAAADVAQDSHDNSLRHPQQQEQEQPYPSNRNLQFDFDWFPEDVELPNSLCWLPFASCEADTCAEVSPLSAEDFNLTQYIEKSWYVQKQQIVPYQDEDQLYCVVATYNRREEDDFIQVQNYGNNNQVNGPPQNSDEDSFFGNLCAEQVDGGELRVAPCFLKWIFGITAGPYWVLAVASDYSWAIVSGGAPTEVRETADDGTVLCTTKEGNSFLDTNGSGLWLFTREQVASEETIAAMENMLLDMGIYTGDLKTVQQEGCTYEGTTIKS